MGYVQRLDNGNTVIGWGATNPTVTEVQPDGSRTFELSLPRGVYSYRAYKFNTPRLVSALKPLVGIQPNGYQLEQNYPNPFNPRTTITFSLPVRSQVALTVYNDIGERVSTLVEGEFLPGSRSIAWNAGSYPSGVYFYRLQARSTDGIGNSVGSPPPFTIDVTRKMLLLK